MEGHDDAGALVGIDGDGREYHRFTKQERAELIDRMLETKYRERATWEEVADKHEVSRSTIRRWRLTDEWRMAEARWRRVMREEARSDTTVLGQNALEVLSDLMNNARSEFTRYSAASKILDLIGVGDEIEEAKVDQSQELMKFMQQMQAKQRHTRELEAKGIDPATVIDVEVKPGGLLPDAIVQQNRLAMAERFAELEELETLVEGGSSGAEGTPEDDDGPWPEHDGPLGLD